MKAPTLISMVRNATDTRTRDVEIDKVLKAIRTGGRRILKLQILEIRKRFKANLAITGGDREAARLAIAGLKIQLPGVLWSGTFSARANDKLIQHSGFLCGDLDNLGERLKEVREKIKASPYLAYLFRSPTNGLKTVFKVPADASKHLASFRAVEKHVLELTGIQIDQACKDVARLCFMSYDPELYINENAVEIEPLPEPEKPRRVTPAGNDAPANSKPTKAQIREMLSVIPKRPEYHDWIKLVAAVGDALSDADAIEVLNEWSPEEAPGEYAKKLLSGFEKIHVGTLIHLARQHGWTPKAEARSSGKADDDSTDLTSFSSTAVDYPAPLSEAAYYGLAGDIVRRIDPHTEADKAAVIIHVLTGFGNLVGRNPHAIADGSRHGLNLNFVCVGTTSKARKGTAYSHMKRIFRRVDEDWTKDCLTTGLNSGEGLIYEVRDPVKKRVKQNGTYSLEIVDDGVSDKRRMFVESELSQSLRVMSREGNTLSAVMRSAWDGEILRTAIKNSPNKATDAHISIGGHVTRDEIRQELTATDQANGFANRFLWFAVRRSKVLPEGGHIEDENFNDLVTRLHEAIKFASTIGEIRRNEKARDLWCAVYPGLSEGKPGLLGAITARAEAQVLRVSCIYALLDLSAVVRVEHLKAALALWDYCERSAQWIFQTGTGNKNADRILAALRVAGQKGLTKWQINNDVFNRNVPKFEIDEALRLLHLQRLAYCVTEKTTTKPAERWFSQANPHEVYEESTPGDGQTGDTSYSSCTQASENSDSGHLDKQSETVIGDELGVARL
jgi:hypothetical protein